MARSHQGKGYATEAVTMLLDYLFIEHNLHRLLANCDRANINSFC
ncbi:GNAT family N-acetyltransferase [Nostoc sp. UHCC 0926]|nr:GNAT family N-acetyltransferase [Nostoc sp. UHCC 0926]WDD33430.1 GNAT family N-acetyltransferase [Nostoc sp. UHCC 0926]